MKRKKHSPSKNFQTFPTRFIQQKYSPSDLQRLQLMMKLLAEDCKDEALIDVLSRTDVNQSLNLRAKATILQSERESSAAGKNISRDKERNMSEDDVKVCAHKMIEEGLDGGLC